MGNRMIWLGTAATGRECLIEAIPSGRGERERKHVEAGALAHPAVADQIDI